MYNYIFGLSQSSSAGYGLFDVFYTLPSYEQYELGNKIKMMGWNVGIEGGEGKKRDGRAG